MYDPLVDAYPATTERNPDSYWAAVSGPAPRHDGPLTKDIVADVAVIGAGYAGMTCALSLARDHGIRPVVLEARSTAWGCSGRNGSFARISGGRASLSTLIKTYGQDTAQAYFAEMREGLETVRGLIGEGKIQCDAQPDGVFKVAALRAHADALQRDTRLYNEVFGYPARFVPAEELPGIHGGAEAFGALYFRDGFAMNPLKLAWGIQQMAQAHGAQIYAGSPVIGWRTEGGRHRLETPSGTVTAGTVVVATNGYTSSRLHPRLSARVLPALSQIIVTQPLSAAQIADSIPSTGCMFDSRNLLFYYRRLPDNRILFGGRSAITGHEAEDPRHRQHLADSLARKFPALAGTRIDYWWSGWVAVSLNALPFIYRVPELPNVFCGGGYAGSGVSFSTRIGTKLAQMAAGKPFDTRATFLTREPKRYPFFPFVRIGQRLAYWWLNRKDMMHAGH